MPNRLAKESSPYLSQHQDNPVDWYPWGEEAFARAKEEDKPILLSIGYAACHWCHVMAHESFEDPEIAELMNDLFINIKVDREERPDVDQVYMNAIHVMGEGGGWPLTAFCDPEGRPYFISTYFPPTQRYGRPGFPEVLRTMARVFREQRDKVDQNARAVLDGLRQIDEHYRKGAVGGDPGALEEGLLVTAGRALAKVSDPKHGGFGTRPKFPSSSAHELLARAGRLKFGKPAREAFMRQCEGMARGGIYDHLGGGFHRYSVDQEWLVPHFEKMLYDNAQLLGIYGDAYAMTGAGAYCGVIEETVAWLEREMLDASGGLYASQDADSEGEEGTFYVWTPQQVREVLGEADAIQFCRAYGVTEGGNFEGRTVLSRVTAASDESTEKALATMCRKLFEARKERVAPDTDTKVLSGWNALAVTGLVRAWEATGHEPARALAERVASFLVEQMLEEGGDRIRRIYKDGKATLDGTLDDYAFTARAFFALAEASGDETWWRRGRKLLDAAVSRFMEERDGVVIFYMTPSDAEEELVHRPESHHDGAIPSGAAVCVECLVRVGHVEDDREAMAIAERYLAGRAPQAAQEPFMASRVLSALDLYLSGIELVVSEGAGRRELFEAARTVYAPNLMLTGPWAADSLLSGKEPAEDGHARAYLCRGQTCEPPVTEAGVLAEKLTAS